MVHELLNIQNGRVDLALVPDIQPELKVCLNQVYLLWHFFYPSPLGNNPDITVRSLFCVELPEYLWRSWYVVKNICSIISIQIDVAIGYQFNCGYETLC